MTEKLVAKTRSDDFKQGQLVTAVVYRRMQEEIDKKTGEVTLTPQYVLGAPLRLAEKGT